MPVDNKTVTEKLVRFTAETKYSDIPPAVTGFTKQLLLKTVSGILAGSIMPSGKKFTGLMKRRNSPEEVGVIGCDFQTSVWDAVFMEAFLAHASELEDDKLEGGEAWDITVIPVLLPLAQKLHLSGESLVEALAVGLEVHVRTCLFSPALLGIGMFPGAIGPAAGGAKAMGLDIDKTRSALGLGMSAVPLAFPNFGTDGHYLESALQALQGIIAADMAKEGMVGNPDIVTFVSNILGKDKVDPDRIVDSLGQRWLLQDIWIKKYPCCFVNHRQIDLLLDMKKKYQLTYDDVLTIEMHGSPSDEKCNRPQPKTEGDLQFSLQNNLAAALLDGDVNFSHINLKIISDPRYVEARSKVNVIIDRSRPAILLATPATLIIKTKDGRSFKGERSWAVGSPREPLNAEQISALYTKFTKDVLTEEQTKKTAESILHLEDLKDVSDLMNALTFIKQAKAPAGQKKKSKA